MSKETGTIKPNQPKKSILDIFKRKQKQTLAAHSLSFSNSLPIPKSEKFKTIMTLLNNVEDCHNIGERDIEKKIWLMISERAKQYAET